MVARLAHPGAQDASTDTLTRSTPRRDEYRDIDELLVRLACAATDYDRMRYRAQAIIRCVPLADRIAYRFVGRGEPGDDLVQVARLGLVKAVDRYRPELGRFVSFAVPTITGDVRRHFRDNTWAMHVPRAVKETHRRVRAASEPLSQRLGRAPTLRELAQTLDLDVTDVVAAMVATYAYHPASLDCPPRWSDDAHPVSPLIQAGCEDLRYDRIEDVLALQTLLAELSERDRTILALRFDQCLSQTAIARRLGISQVQVSRLLSAILNRLRVRLCEEPESTEVC